jgi:hypothetical protein
MRASLHINVVIFFEFLIPMVVPFAFIFIGMPNSNDVLFIFILQVVGLYLLGRFIGRKIPSNLQRLLFQGHSKRYLFYSLSLQ